MQIQYHYTLKDNILIIYYTFIKQKYTLDSIAKYNRTQTIDMM